MCLATLIDATVLFAFSRNVHQSLIHVLFWCGRNPLSAFVSLLLLCPAYRPSLPKVMQYLCLASQSRSPFTDSSPSNKAPTAGQSGDEDSVRECKAGHKGAGKPVLNWLKVCTLYQTPIFCSCCVLKYIMYCNIPPDMICCICCVLH